MPLRCAARCAALPALLFILAAQAGCAARARPPELVALEKLRGDPMLSDADRRAFDLLAAADDLMVTAQGEWQGGKDDRARRDATVGLIKMKMALAILDTKHAQTRLAALDAETALAEDEDARVGEELAIAEEEVALLERLRTAKAAVARQTQKADALDGLRKAELAVRTADTVDTRDYAKAKYTAAAAMLQEAHKQFDAGNWAEVITRTALAASEADAGTAIARPLYEKAAATMSDRARDRALEADATGLPGVTTRLEREGDVQRLVLLLVGLFESGKTALAPKGAATLDAVHDLLVKYPTYSVQVTGFPDASAKPGDQAPTSLARANAIFWSLVKRGIDPNRMTVDTKTPSDAGSAPDPRVRDASVELTLLYHIDHAP